MELINLIGALFGATFGLILGIIKILMILIILGVALFKGYNNVWIWAVLTFILPWPFPIFSLLLVLYLPKKMPKFPKHLRHHEDFVGKNPVIVSIMALCAMIAKADGNVTKGEIQFIKKFIIGHFGIGEDELNEYAGAFNYGKAHPEEYLIFIDIIKSYYRTRRDYIMLLAYLFTGVSQQEGENTNAKEQETRKIILALGLSEYEYQALKQSYRQSTQGGEYTHNQWGNYDTYQNQESLVKKYTQVLGVSEQASMSEIKKAYRKLVKEYHPDKLSAGSVPQDYIDFANQKIRDINEAYEYLEKIKGNK